MHYNFPNLFFNERCSRLLFLNLCFFIFNRLFLNTESAYTVLSTSSSHIDSTGCGIRIVAICWGLMNLDKVGTGLTIAETEAIDMNRTGVNGSVLKMLRNIVARKDFRAARWSARRLDPQTENGLGERVIEKTKFPVDISSN